MNTQQQIEGKAQEAPLFLPAQGGKVPPIENFPQPPRQPPRPRNNRWLAIGTVIVAIALIASLGAIFLPGLMQRPGSQVKPTPVPTAPVTPGPSDQTPSPPTGVVLGPQACPTAVSDPAHWDAIIGTQHGTSTVESVSCANIMDTPALQAVVTVRHQGSESVLDVYVYNKITSAKPTQIFKLTGLVKGDAKISGYNTVMTAEVDKNSSLNASKPISAMTPDLFREFDWSSKDGTLAQTAFLGIFPDLTRYQAEQDQALGNQGENAWKYDAVQVAKALEAKFFAWQRTVTAKLISGGGSKDVSAKVLVQGAPAQGAQSTGPSAVVTLSRLEGNMHNLWVVIGVEDANMLTLTNIASGSLISSPVTLEGTGGAFEAVIGRAIVFDHLYTDIGHAQVIGDNGMGKANYSTKVLYTSSFKGVQEGVVAVYQTNAGISTETYYAVMVKVLLNPEPKVALGPLPCPDKVSNPAYWNAFVSTPADPAVVESVTCGNLLSNPTLQAVVVARQIKSTGPTYRSVSVFDKITDPQPKLLFRLANLYHGEAQISGYSTILTGEVDPNSSINQGKAEDQMTVDLFREFQWSVEQGTIVRLVFPGIYPDLTRYQAEADQVAVNHGQESWKNDAAAVARNLTVNLLKWSPTAQTTMVSGGGPKDVDAVVQVQSTSPAHPTIKVTLSRLEGNTHNIWMAIAVTDGSYMSITSPQKGTTLLSPVKVTGMGSAFEGDVGTVFVLDHLYNDIGHAKGIAASNGITTFTATVPYTITFHNGVQDGVLAFYRYSEADGSIAGAVMEKVLVSP